MNYRSQKLIIGILGMSDNQFTPRLLEYMANEDIHVDFVIYWKPSIKDQYKRFKRKLKLAGIGPTIQRIYYALITSKSVRKKYNQRNYKKEYREYFVPSHNSVECKKILAEEKVDILLLATDAIITPKILEIPRIATLNAHPGWIPQFRGLGSLYFQLEKGKLPAVSVHQVDEGIDTGPLFLREYIKVDAKKGLEHIEEEVNTLQCKLMAKVVKMILEKGNVQYIDTFNEPSNMTRGMSFKRKKNLDYKLKSGKLVLGSSTLSKR